MQANTANEHSDALTHLPTMPVASKSRVRACFVLASDLPHASEKFPASKLCGTASNTGERFIKDDEQA